MYLHRDGWWHIRICARQRTKATMVWPQRSFLQLKGSRSLKVSNQGHSWYRVNASSQGHSRYRVKDRIAYRVGHSKSQGIESRSLKVSSQGIESRSLKVSSQENSRSQGRSRSRNASRRRRARFRWRRIPLIVLRSWPRNRSRMATTAAS